LASRAATQFYAALAAFGVAGVTAFLISQRRWIGLVGGVAIALIGRPILLRSEGPTLTLPSMAGGKSRAESASLRGSC